ncbi:MAG: membrane dipeptidase [Ginsengibacter sp.]
MFNIDAHLDLSMNAMEWNRDLTLSLDKLNSREKNMNDKPGRGKATVSFPELRKGNFGLIVATQIARYVAEDNNLPGWHTPEQAWAHTQAQLAWYKAMEAKGELSQVTDLKSLELLINSCKNDHHTIGYILSLEGADSLITIDHLQIAYQYGLRALGPAHYGPGRYANGTDSSGQLNEQGKLLLKEMQLLNMILDVTHLCDDAFFDAMDLYYGPVWASHNNCRKIVDHNRQFSDKQIALLIEKGAVIGAAFDAWMLVPGWERHVSDPVSKYCNLTSVINHIDHICQIAGNANHVGIGSDLDGGFGSEQCPSDVQSIADINKIKKMLSDKGYKNTDIENIMHNNWLTFLRNAWSLEGST